ncbi:beclin-1-like protein A [Microplitis mediator]|uniref:beclin-1-like protein A n=1 Tax=Microplitis mediator TaxID=375433 RepID=UPI0025530146|nr:beclin-1-like protein A [Microplitis mediator]
MENVTLVDFLICFGRLIWYLIGLFLELSLLTFTISITELSKFSLSARIIIIFLSIGLMLMTMSPIQNPINLYDGIENVNRQNKLYETFERQLYQGIYPPVIGDDYPKTIGRKIMENNSHESLMLFSGSLDDFIKTGQRNSDNNNNNNRNGDEKVECVSIKFLSENISLDLEKSTRVIENKLCEMNKEIESKEFITETELSDEFRVRDSFVNKINCDINSLVEKIIEFVQEFTQSFDSTEYEISQNYSSDTFVQVNELRSVVMSTEISKIVLKSTVASDININKYNNNNDKKKFINSGGDDEQLEKVIVVINPDSTSEITEDTVVSEKSWEQFERVEEF